MGKRVKMVGGRLEKKGLEKGLHRSHETGFLMGWDFIKWKGNVNSYTAHFHMNILMKANKALPG